MVRGRTTRSLSYEILIFVPLPFLFYVTIKGMDKIIKTISENGAFRAYVLDSTETVRTAQEKHQTLASSTVALGRTLIASQILAANEKGDTKITVKVLGTSSLGAIITVADTKGTVKGYVQNSGVDIKKTATGEVLVGPFVGNGEFLVITDYGTGNPYHSMTPLVSGEIGEDILSNRKSTNSFSCWLECTPRYQRQGQGCWRISLASSPWCQRRRNHPL